MPTYSYACKNCDHQFEIQQSFSDDTLTTCPNCGGEVRKLFGNLGVTFKGSGFYRTDSAKKSEPKKESKPATD
jgi:putative FmdB family regulatory protein